MIIVEPIINCVADSYRIQGVEILGQRKVAPISEARILTLYLIQRYIRRGPAYAAYRLGVSKQAAIYAYTRARDLMEIDTQFRQRVKDIESQIDKRVALEFERIA